MYLIKKNKKYLIFYHQKQHFTNKNTKSYITQLIQNSQIIAPYFLKMFSNL